MPVSERVIRYWSPSHAERFGCCAIRRRRCRKSVSRNCSTERGFAETPALRREDTSVAPEEADSYIGSGGARLARRKHSVCSVEHNARQSATGSPALSRNRHPRGRTAPGRECAPSMTRSRFTSSWRGAPIGTRTTPKVASVGRPPRGCHGSRRANSAFEAP